MIWDYVLAFNLLNVDIIIFPYIFSSSNKKETINKEITLKSFISTEGYNTITLTVPILLH